MKISDDELDAMIAMQRAMAISTAIEKMDGTSDRHKKIHDALSELATLRRTDAKLKATLRECRPYVQQAVNEDEREYNLRPLDEACMANLEESSALLAALAALAGEVG